jgi:hypothetical protein
VEQEGPLELPQAVYMDVVAVELDNLLPTNLHF